MSYTYVHSSFRSVAIIVSYDRDRKVGWFLVACCFNVQRRPHWQSFIRSSHLARRFAVFPFFSILYLCALLPSMEFIMSYLSMVIIFELVSVFTSKNL